MHPLRLHNVIKELYGFNFPNTKDIISLSSGAGSKVTELKFSMEPSSSVYQAHINVFRQESQEKIDLNAHC